MKRELKLWIFANDDWKYVTIAEPIPMKRELKLCHQDSIIDLCRSLEL